MKKLTTLARYSLLVYSVNLMSCGTPDEAVEPVIQVGTTQTIKVATDKSLSVYRIEVDSELITARINRTYDNAILIKLVVNENAKLGERTLTMFYPDGEENQTIRIIAASQQKDT